jgi:hypothetical protein
MTIPPDRGQPRGVSRPMAPLSWGELIDKVTILEIKSERLSSRRALSNVRKELAFLLQIVESAAAEAAIGTLSQQLRSVNEELWDVEDKIREMEAAGKFNAGFIELARSVYRLNDRRAKLKRDINLIMNSDLVEEKSYKDWGGG